MGAQATKSRGRWPAPSIRAWRSFESGDGRQSGACCKSKLSRPAARRGTPVAGPSHRYRPTSLERRRCDDPDLPHRRRLRRLGLFLRSPAAAATDSSPVERRPSSASSSAATTRRPAAPMPGRASRSRRRRSASCAGRRRSIPTPGRRRDSHSSSATPACSTAASTAPAQQPLRRDHRHHAEPGASAARTAST